MLVYMYIFILCSRLWTWDAIGIAGSLQRIIYEGGLERAVAILEFVMSSDSTIQTLICSVVDEQVQLTCVHIYIYICIYIVYR